MWSFSGYNEIQKPRRKNILIDYSRLQRIIGAGSYGQLRTSHSGRVEDYLGDGPKNRQDEWTDSIAVGNRSFIEKVKSLLGFRAKGRKVHGVEKGYQLREGPAPYNALFGAKKRDIGPENTYLWNMNL
jgi:putative transposase